MKHITIKDIAREAGVSTATVSYVINNKKFVSMKLREKVNKIILKYNYHKNITASSLRGKTTEMIGLIVPDSSNPVFSAINREIGRFCRDKNYDIVICDSKYDYKKEIEYIWALHARNIDGLIFYPSIENIESFKILNDLRIPTIMIERKIEGLNADVILLDNYKAYIDVVSFLADLGHKKIAYINKEPHLYQSKIKFKGFLEGLKINNLKCEDSFIMNDNIAGYTFKDGYRDVQKFFNMTNKPTAIIVHNDVLAIGAIRAIKDRGFRVPQDFSIIGSDDDEIGNYLEVKLTSLTSEEKKIAQKAFFLLFKRINDDLDKKAQEVLIPRTLKIRDSVANIKYKKDQKIS